MVAEVVEAELVRSAVIKCNPYYRGAVIAFFAGEAKTIVSKWLEI